LTTDIDAKQIDLVFSEQGFERFRLRSKAHQVPVENFNVLETARGDLLDCSFIVNECHVGDVLHVCHSAARTDELAKGIGHIADVHFGNLPFRSFSIFFCFYYR